VIDPEELLTGLVRVRARAGLGTVEGDPQRLTGGAVMESWRFTVGDSAYVLRRRSKVRRGGLLTVWVGRR
jgi:hypothetical protein